MLARDVHLFTGISCWGQIFEFEILFEKIHLYWFYKTQQNNFLQEHVEVLSELPNWKTLTLVEIMISFILVIIIDYERSTPHSTALIRSYA